ncbi:MAG: ABC transporter substrate-binding protein [Clostridiales Family XIII bacterium]|jgi:arabinosaccharide transport system substrate-binding protein|nr:ABC transporter substrate-binding protein [Clostridiales Family XIII bacterium]
MKKRSIVAILLIAIMIMGSFSACGKSSKKEEESTTTKDGKSVLKLWTFVDLHGEFFQEMAESWNEENPDRQIEVDVNVLPYEDMHNKLQIALSSGEGTPDFVDIEVSRFANFTQGTPALLDLSKYAKPYEADVVKSRLELYTTDGKLYGMPTHVGTTVAFYNTELLDAAGIDYTTLKTWDDFKAAGTKYFEATGKHLGNIDTSALFQMNLQLAQRGTDWVDKDDNVKVNTPEIIDALSQVKELADANAIATIPTGQTAMEEAYGSINEGDFAAVIMPEWYMSRYLNYMPDLNGKIAIATPPVNSDSVNQSVGLGGTGTAVVADKPNAELAGEFIAYAKLSYEGGVKIWDKLGFDPVNTKVWEDDAVTHNPDNQYNKYFQNNIFDVLSEMKDGLAIQKSFALPVYPSIDVEMGTVTLNEVFENGADVKKSLDTAQEDLETELGL